MQPIKYREQPAVVENLCGECIHLIVKQNLRDVNISLH